MSEPDPQPRPPDSGLRREILCPRCRRRLMALRTPRCNWCGAAIAETDYQAVALPPGRTIDLPRPNAVPFGSPYTPTPFWQANPFVRTVRPLQPWERKLRLVGAIVLGGLLLVRIGYELYAIWTLHRLIHGLH